MEQREGERAGPDRPEQTANDRSRSTQDRAAAPRQAAVPARPHARPAHGQDHPGRGGLVRAGRVVAHQRPAGAGPADRAAGGAADHVRDGRARAGADRQRGGRGAGRHPLRRGGRAHLVEPGLRGGDLADRRPAAAARPAPARGGDHRDAGARGRRHRVGRVRPGRRDADRGGRRGGGQPADRAAAVHPADPGRDRRAGRPDGRLRPRPGRDAARASGPASRRGPGADPGPRARRRGGPGRPRPGPDRAERPAQPARPAGPGGPPAAAQRRHRARARPDRPAQPGPGAARPHLLPGRGRGRRGVPDRGPAGAGRRAGRRRGGDRGRGPRRRWHRAGDPRGDRRAAGRPAPRRDRLGALLLVDPHVDPAAWQQHGALLAAVDRLRVEIAAAEIDPACAMSEAAAEAGDVPTERGDPSRERSSDHHAQRRQHHPAARLRGLPDQAGRHRAGGPHRAGDRLPAHRHRGDVRQREGGRRGHPGLRHPPRRDLRDQQAEQRLPPPGRRPAGLRRHAARPGHGPDRPVPDPLAAADPLRRRLRLHLADAWRSSPRTAGPARSASPTSRSGTCRSWPPRPRRCRRSTRSRCTRT